MAVNGYATTNGQSYGAPEQTYDAQAAKSTSANEYATTNTSSASGNNPDISKEEVGWYFVEQYYTTLSKSPEKLYLFYTKQSQLVTGVEAEKVSVCVGQKSISEKIRELDIQDCKVRVTNVDSQGSRSNIVIQVIGEISNKSQPQRKFTQTFVLAEQTNGYFVLNDIFRYILDDNEYEPEQEEPQDIARTEAAAGGYQEPAPTAEPAAQAGLTNSSDPVAQEHDAAIVDKSLEEAVKTQPEVEAEPAVNGDAVDASGSHAVAEDAPAAATAPVTTADAAEEAQSTPIAEVATSEKPQDPEPSPVASPPAKAAPAQPSARAKPAGPKTWANLVAGGRVAPAVPAASAVSPSAPSAPAKKPAPAQAAAPSASAQPAPAATASAPQQGPERSATPMSSESEWQTAGHEHKRQQSRAQPQQPAEENKRGYIKNVIESVDQTVLSDALNAVAKLVYMDISRQRKSCFVEYATAADYKAAVAANPYEIDGQKLFVEERRVNNFNGGRGGFPARGAPRGQGPPRGGRGGRGGFRGRGGAQAA